MSRVAGARASTLKTRIEEARARTVSWLRTMALPRVAPRALRFSAAHDPERWPGMVLPGTYNGVQCLALIGAMDDTVRAERLATVRWLESHRDDDGTFRVPGMRDGAVFKKADPAETWRYIDFHVTNYSLGAIEALDPDRVPALGFVRPWLDPAYLDTWLTARDWADPWLEGNNLVNLASFLALLERFGESPERGRAVAALERLLDRLEALQNPLSGFWGDRPRGPASRLHAMAGAMHAFHLWYARRRALPHHAAAVDYTLGLDPGEDMGACLDVDAVDLLFHGARLTGYRADDVDRWMHHKLERLLASQLGDGGFADASDGMLRLDGWVGGYAEPQGRSNTFATWFRWIAIALACEQLWPGWRGWRFRRMLGIGFCRTR